MGGKCSCLRNGSKYTRTTFSTSLYIHDKIMKENLKEENNIDNVKERIQRSKINWSEVGKFKIDVEEVAEVSNVEVFKTFQMHPKWGSFFQTCGKGGVGELVIGKKFAEGGQAKLYEAQIEWNDPSYYDFNLKHPCEWVLKVFRKGTSL